LSLDPSVLRSISFSISQENNVIQKFWMCVYTVAVTLPDLAEVPAPGDTTPLTPQSAKRAIRFAEQAVIEGLLTNM